MPPRGNRTILNVEELEPRWTPAGNVQVTQVGNLGLRITGDGAANLIDIQFNGIDTYTITGYNGTDINGSPFSSSFTFANNRAPFLRVNLKGGSDSLTIGTLSLVTIGTSATFRSVNIKTGGGDDTVLIEGHDFLRAVNINTGNGNDSVYFSDTGGAGFAARFRRNVTVRTGNGDDIVAAVESTWDRALRIFTGKGDDNVIVGSPLLFGQITGVVHGRTTISTGKGEDFVAVNMADLRGKTIIRTGAGDEDPFNPFRTIIYGPFGVFTPIGVYITDSTLGDNCKIVLGGGDDGLLTFNATFQKRFTVRGGTGNDNIGIDSTTVDGRTTIKTGRGDDKLVNPFGLSGINNSTFNGSVAILTGRGVDEVFVESSTFQKAPLISTGRGNDTIRNQPAPFVTGGVDVSTSTFRRRFTILTGSGIDEVRVDDLTLRRTMTIATGDNGDFVDVGTLRGGKRSRVFIKTEKDNDEVFIGSTFNNLIEPVMIIEGGAGSDLIQAGNGVTFNRRLHVDGGGGNDTIQMIDFAALKDVFIFGKSGSDQIDLSGLLNRSPIGRDLFIHGGGGNNSITFGTFIFNNGIDVARDVIILTGPGQDNLTLHGSKVNRNMFIQTGAGQDTAFLGAFGIITFPYTSIFTSGTDVVGTLRINTGKGQDDVGILDSDIGKRVRINAGSDANRVFLVDSNVGTTTINTGRSSAAGALIGIVNTNFDSLLSIDTGIGADQVLFFDVTVGTTLNVSMRGGADLFDAFNLTVFQTTLVNTASGDDDVVLDGFINEAVLFGKAMFLLGSGNDDVQVGTVRFTSSDPAVFDGGTGTNTITHSIFVDYLVPPDLINIS